METALRGHQDASISTPPQAEGSEDITPTPSDAVLEQFGVALIAPLGGRLNQHWLVEARYERLVLRRWAQPADEIDYELRLLGTDRRAGVAGRAGRRRADRAEPGMSGACAPFLPGDPPAEKVFGCRAACAQAAISCIPRRPGTAGAFGKRGTWRRCADTLGDPTLHGLCYDHERAQPEEVRILRMASAPRPHADCRDFRCKTVPASSSMTRDFAPWTLRFIDGRLTGILDFELAHWDHRIGDFALAWRGKYNDVIHGYAEVSPLSRTSGRCSRRSGGHI